MKQVMKNQGGYVLGYVLVLVVVVSLISVVACTTALKNLNAQTAAVNYTRAKYDAEGAMERFVAELQYEMVETAKAINTEFPQKNDEDIVAALQEKIDIAILGSEESGVEGIVSGIEGDGSKYQISVKGKNLDEYDGYGFVAYHRDETGSTPIRGYFPMVLTVEISNHAVKVDAVINVIFNATEDGAEPLYTITGAAFEFVSYSVSTIPQTDLEGGSGS